MMGNIQSLDVQVPHEIVQYWGWFLAFGVALLLIGLVAIVRSVTATIVSMVFFGWLLVLACGIEIAQAVMVGHWAGFFHHLVAAVLFGVTGVLMVTRPVLSAEVATMLIALFFLVSGLFQFFGSIWVAQPGWGWQAADGIIAFVLGLLVLAQWPASGLWVIGLFIGIDLFFYGAAWIAIALGLRASSGIFVKQPAELTANELVPHPISWNENDCPQFQTGFSSDTARSFRRRSAASSCPGWPHR